MDKTRRQEFFHLMAYGLNFTKLEADYLDNVDVTLADRNKRYNSSEEHTRNCYLAATLRRIYREHKSQTDLMVGGKGSMHDLSHDHCIEMILTKIARIATGAFVEDNYHDIEGYCRLALRDAVIVDRQDRPLQHKTHHNLSTKAYDREPGRCQELMRETAQTFQCINKFNHEGDHNFTGGAI